MKESGFQELAQRIAYLERRIAELEKRVDLLHRLVLEQRVLVSRP